MADLLFKKIFQGKEINRVILINLKMYFIFSNTKIYIHFHIIIFNVIFYKYIFFFFLIHISYLKI